MKYTCVKCKTEEIADRPPEHWQIKRPWTGKSSKVGDLEFKIRGIVLCDLCGESQDSYVDVLFEEKRPFLKIEQAIISSINRKDRRP